MKTLVLLLTLFALPNPGSIFASGPGSGRDSTRQQSFGLNDPRNPDCPCHKYQQLAEEEYRKLQKGKQRSGKPVWSFGTGSRIRPFHLNPGRRH